MSIGQQHDGDRVEYIYSEALETQRFLSFCFLPKRMHYKMSLIMLS